MIQYFTRDLISQIVVFQAFMLLILLTNIWITHRARRHSLPSKLPKVSIMVPARNEEITIEACLRSLLVQDYPDFEVFVLDDQSTDATLSIVQRLAAEYLRLRVLNGAPATQKIAGKNWACAQLAEQAKGEYFLFTDADTMHQPGMLAGVVGAMLGEKADMLTGFPRQVVKTWGERLLVPFFTWASLNFIPLGLAYLMRSTVLSVAVGQLMIFKRDAYQVVGGHAALGTNFLDDIVLARHIKAAKLRWRVLSIADLVICRMYRNSQKAYAGLTKSLFGAFDYRLLSYLFVILWLVSMTWVPLVVSTLWLAGLAPLANPVVLLACLGLGLFTWLIAYIEIRVPIYLALLYPLTILVNAWVMLRSLVFTLTGKLRWKDRALEKPRWKWL